MGVRGRMHFQGGSSERWQWGRPLGESWEHSPEQGNLGRKTKVWEVLTLTVQTSQPPPPPPLPQKLLRPTPSSQATGPLPPPPQVWGTCRAACAAFSKAAPPPPLPRASAHPSRSQASLNQPSAHPCSSCVLSTSQPSPSSLFSLLHPINHAVLKALPWRPVACSPGSSPMDATGRPHNPPQLAGPPLLYVKVISGCLRRESVEVKQTTSRGEVQVQGPATPQRLATQKLPPTPIVSRA